MCDDLLESFLCGKVYFGPEVQVGDIHSETQMD